MNRLLKRRGEIRVEIAEERVLVRVSGIGARSPTLEKNAAIIQLEAGLIAERRDLFRDQAIGAGRLQQGFDECVEVLRLERAHGRRVGPERATAWALRRAKDLAERAA